MMAGDARDRPPGEVDPESFWSPEKSASRAEIVARLAVSFAISLEECGMLDDVIGPPALNFPMWEEAIVRDVVARLKARKAGRR